MARDLFSRLEKEEKDTTVEIVICLGVFSNAALYYTGGPIPFSEYIEILVFGFVMLLIYWLWTRHNKNRNSKSDDAIVEPESPFDR